MNYYRDMFNECRCDMKKVLGRTRVVDIDEIITKYIRKRAVLTLRYEFASIFEKQVLVSLQKYDVLELPSIIIGSGTRHFFPGAYY